MSFNDTLRLPYKVQVSTAGLNDDQLQSAIRDGYKSYFRSPKDLKVIVKRNEFLVDARGLIKKPGQYVIQKESSLDELIAAAGGLQESSSTDKSPKYVRITGPDGNAFVRLADYYAGGKDLSPTWQGGETLFFQSDNSLSDGKGAGRSAVSILGQVKNPSEYSVESQGNFYTYLVKAGGPTDRADLSNVTLLRAENGQEYGLNFSAMDFKKIPPIRGGDTLIVNADNPTVTEKQTRIAANIANIISAIGIIIIAAVN